MAISISNKASIFSGSNLSSYATGSWTPGANRLAICSVQSELSGSPAIPTVTGNGLTWSQLVSYQDDTAGTQSRITVFVAKTGGSPSAGTVTADFGAETQVGCNIIVDEADGVDISGTALQAVVQHKTGSTDSGTSETIVLDSAITSGNASYGCFHHQADETTSNGSGYTTLGNGSHAGPSSALLTEYKAAGSTTVDASWTTNSGRGGVALEIKAAATSITGTLSKTQSSDTISSSSKVQLKASLSKAQSGDTLSSISDLIIKGALSKAQAGDSLSAAGQIAIKGVFSRTQDNNTLSAAADLIAQGILSAVQSDNTLDSSGALSINATLTQTQQDNSLLSAGVLPISGSVVQTQQGQTIIAAGNGLQPGITGSANLTQEDNELIAFGDAHLKASVNVTQQENTLNALGRLLAKATLNLTQQGDTAVSSGSVTITAVLDISQQGNTVIASAITPRQGSIDVTQDDQLATISGKVNLKALLNALQAGNVLSSVIQYIPPVQGPGGLDVITADDVDIIHAEINGIIYADDINEL